MTNEAKTEKIDSYCERQRAWLLDYFKKNDKALQKDAEAIINDFFASHNEITQAYNALIAHYADLDRPFPRIERGLFKKDYFSWPSLPYPRYYAELAALCFLYAYETWDENLLQQAEDMANWQLNTLDYYGMPFFSLWSQQKSAPADLLLANCFLFNFAAQFSFRKKDIFSSVCFIQRNYLERQGFKSNHFSELVFFFNPPSQAIEIPFLSGSFEDKELLLFGKRSSDVSSYVTANGCKSGYGAFYCDQCGIINFAPQILPLGECSQFGIVNAGASKVGEKENHYLFHSRLASKAHFETAYEDLDEAGYSGSWILTEVKLANTNLALSTEIQGSILPQNICFAFFLKGEACLVAKSQRLRPHSLDRYKGPSHLLEIVGSTEKIAISCMPSTTMEVIPLSGEGHFWGADFLLAYYYQTSKLSWNIEKLKIR